MIRFLVVQGNRSQQVEHLISYNFTMHHFNDFYKKEVILKYYTHTAMKQGCKLKELNTKAIFKLK